MWHTNSRNSFNETPHYKKKSVKGNNRKDTSQKAAQEKKIYKIKQ